MNCRELKQLRRELEFYKKNYNKYSDDERYRRLKSIQTRLNRIFLDPDSCNECRSQANDLMTQFSLN
jgi:hypothetical protein